MLNDTRMSLDDVLKCGSNLEMSPPCATTSSRFWVVWAWAGPARAPGTAPAAPSAAAPLRSSRRVSLIVGSSFSFSLSGGVLYRTSAAECQACRVLCSSPMSRSSEEMEALGLEIGIERQGGVHPSRSHDDEGHVVDEAHPPTACRGQATHGRGMACPVHPLDLERAGAVGELESSGHAEPMLDQRHR